MDTYNYNPQSNSRHISIGMKAPDFYANTTFGPLKLSDYKGKWIVLFSHPGDFTPVCTSEFIAFAKEKEKFNSLNTQLIGLSIDSNPSHLAWVNQIYESTGIQIPFPVIADRTGEIARMYGMIAQDTSTQETVRNVYFIDPNMIIRAILIYPLTNGRNIYEIIRLLEALQTTDKAKVITPANWVPGQPNLVPIPQTYEQLEQRRDNPESVDLSCTNWYTCYRKPVQQ